MKQIFVANSKGGSGKTTLATQIASYYAARGMRVAIADHDPQRSSLDWLKSRPESCVPIDGVAAFCGDKPDESVELLVHDMPAGIDADTLVAAALGHQLLIPILASPTDIKAGFRFLMALSRAGGADRDAIRIGMVANRIKVRTHYFKVLEAFLTKLDMPLVGIIRDTQNYIRAMDAGISIFDLPAHRVGRDIEQWSDIVAWLD